MSEHARRTLERPTTRVGFKILRARALRHGGTFNRGRPVSCTPDGEKRGGGHPDNTPPQMLAARVPCVPRARVEQRRAGRIERPATNPSPTPLRCGVTPPPKRMSRAASSGGDSPPSTYVWYASFGSNILLERFECYLHGCLLYTSPSPRDQRGSRMPSSA